MNKMKILTITCILIPLVIASVDCQTKQKDLSIRFGRQLSFWPFNMFSPALSRQFYDMIDIMTDVAMVTFLGLPILGLVAVSELYVK